MVAQWEAAAVQLQARYLVITPMVQWEAAAVQLQVRLGLGLGLADGGAVGGRSSAAAG